MSKKFFSKIFGLLAFNLLLSAGLSVPALSHAQTAWPSKPVRLVVTFPPGGVTDVLARTLADKLSTSLKESFIVDPKGGAGGNIGADVVAKAKPDGYTFGIATDNLFTINSLLYRKMSFNPATDLVPVATLVSFSQLLTCNPALKIKTLDGLFQLAKKKNLTYASGGAGVPGHLAMELLLSKADVSMTHVPYKGAVPAATDILGNQVDCGFLPGPTVIPFVATEKLVALAVSSEKRSPLAPTVPTVAEAGIPGFDASFNLILFAPAGTPQAIISKMSDEIAGILAQPDVIERLKSVDLTPVGAGPAQTNKILATSGSIWISVVKRLDLRLD
jgi:tripartite-type tricarboxylate transporter receptor subunit TctC